MMFNLQIYVHNVAKHIFKITLIILNLRIPEVVTRRDIEVVMHAFMLVLSEVIHVEREDGARYQET